MTWGKRNLNWRPALWLQSLIVGALTAPFFLLAAPLDPEKHHDGFPLAPAIAVSEGLTVHRDAHSQYGPLTAWIQGAWLSVFGDTLLSTRILTALLLTLSAVLIAILMRQLRMPALTAVATATAWSFLSPAWMFIPMIGLGLLAWASITFLVLSLLSVIAAVASRGTHVGLMVTSGAFLGLSAFARGQIAAVVIALWLVAMIITLPKDGRIRAVTATLGGFGSAVAVVLSILAVSSALTYFIQDTLTEPSGYYVNLNYLYEFRLWILASVPLVALLVSARFQGRLRWLGKSSLGVLLSIMIATVGVISYFIGSETDPAVLRLAFLLGYTAFALFFVAMIAAIVFWLLDFLKHLQWRMREKPSKPLGSGESQFGRTALLSIGAGSTVQFFPIFDAYHLWYLAPIPLVLLIAYLWDQRSIQLRRRVLVLLCALSVAGASVSIINAAQPRQTWDRGGVLEGMRMSTEVYSELEIIDVFLIKNVQSSFINRCGVPLFTVWDGKFNSGDRRHFYAPGVIGPAEISRNQPVLYCEDADPTVEEFAEINGLTISDALTSLPSHLYWLTPKAPASS